MNTHCMYEYEPALVVEGQISLFVQEPFISKTYFTWLYYESMKRKHIFLVEIRISLQTTLVFTYFINCPNAHANHRALFLVYKIE